MGTVELVIHHPRRKRTDLADALTTITEHLHHKNADAVAHGILGGAFGYGGEWNSPVFEMRPFCWGDCDCGSEEREAAWSAAHKHAEDCYQKELTRERVAAGGKIDPRYTTFDRIEWPEGWSSDYQRRKEEAIYRKLCEKHGFDYSDGGYAMHCSCGHRAAFGAWVEKNGHTPTCCLELPNFRHKASGLEVRWYKYIGRDMEVKGSGNVTKILAECLADIAAPPFEPYKPEPIPDEVFMEWAEESRAMHEEREAESKRAWRMEKRARGKRKHPTRPLRTPFNRAAYRDRAPF